LRLEDSPTGIQHRLGHPGFCQFQAAHIADDYQLVRLENLARKLMQGVFSSPRCGAMQALGLEPMTPTLRRGDSLFDVSVIVSEPMRSKYSHARAVSLSRSKAVSHRAGLAKGRAAL
jgi:hypothetical protein